jgi:hypothetical protein
VRSGADTGHADADPGVGQRLVAAYLGRTGAVATLTLLTYAVVPPPGTLAIARITALVGLLLVPVVGRDVRYWGVLLGLAAVGTLRQPWLDLDNHHVLQLYWFAGLTLACLAGDVAGTLQRIARLLVGLAFVYAMAWKLLVPDFADGTFLTYLLSVEPTVEAAAVAVGWQEPGVVAANRAELTARQGDPTAQPGVVTLEVAPETERAARVLAWLTIASEAAVALTFLVPLARRWAWLRDLTLLVFVATAYLLLPVITFGVLLAAMGLAQSSLPEPRATALYLAVALLIVVVT